MGGTPPGRATVSVRRADTTRFAILRTYKVSIDGDPVGAIRRGTVVSFDVSPGDHEVQVKIDWLLSPVVTVSLGQGESVSLACSAVPSRRRPPWLRRLRP